MVEVSQSNRPYKMTTFVVSEA